MIVRICFGKGYERMVECDTIHKTMNKEKFELMLYKNGKHIESNSWELKPGEKIQVFIMENGKTVDRIDLEIAASPK